MNGRARRREEAEDAALRGLRQAGDWHCAIEIARYTGWPWRSIARALIRLESLGAVRLDMRQWQSAAHRKRVTRVYAITDDRREWGAWPSWAFPRISKSMHSCGGAIQWQKGV